MFFIRRKKKGKKDIIAYNTFLGTSEHLELLTTFVEEVVVVIDINSKSQTMGASGGCKAMHHDKKCSKVDPSAISIFLGAKLFTRSWIRFKNYS